MQKGNCRKEDKRKSRASVPCNCYLSFLISALLIPFADVEKGLSFLLSFPYLRKQKKKYDFFLFRLDLRKMHAIMKTSIKRTPLLGLFGFNVLVRFCCTNPLLGRSPFGEAIFLFSFSFYAFLFVFPCPFLLSPDGVCLMEISSFSLKDGISFFMIQSLFKNILLLFFLFKTPSSAGGVFCFLVMMGTDAHIFSLLNREMTVVIIYKKRKGKREERNRTRRCKKWTRRQKC